MRSDLRLGPIEVRRRGPSVQWEPNSPLVAVRCAAIGLAGALEDDRQRWLVGYRRLLDGLDEPLQVLIEATPGSAGDSSLASHLPAALDELRGLDLSFVDHVGSLATTRRLAASFITTAAQSSRLTAALDEMGIAYHTSDVPYGPAFGEEYADRQLTAEGFHRTWFVARLPGIELDPGWLFNLLPEGLKLTLGWHVGPLPAAWIAIFLQRQLISMRASRMLEQSTGNRDPELAGALPSAEDLQRRLVSSQEKAFHVSTYLTLTAHTPDELASGSLRVETAARAIMCGLTPCTLRMLDGYLATRTGGPDRLRRHKVLDSSTLVTLVPWRDGEIQHAGGIVLGRNRGTGAAVMADPFDARRFANANIGVFGHSGAGKTYLLSTIALGALGLGMQVFIVDPEHEYGRLASLLGGLDVQLALGSGYALNVLDRRGFELMDESWLGPAAADAVDLCACICGGLDESERAVIESAVRAAYGEIQQPVLSDVADRLPEGSRVRIIVGRWVQGSLGQIFSSPTNVDLESPIVAFGMRELRDEMVAPMHFLLAEALWSRIKRRDRRRLLVIDELGLLFEDSTIRRFVVGLARRIRKYDGSLVFATQNPGDLLASEQGAVVATNPALLFLGAQRSGEAAKLQEAFRLSPAHRSQLETARRGEFLLVAGRERLGLRVQAPPWQEEVMRMARHTARPPPALVG